MMRTLNSILKKLFSLKIYFLVAVFQILSFQNCSNTMQVIANETTLPSSQDQKKPSNLDTSMIDATAFGVVADGKTDNTLALQKAVSACASLNTYNSRHTGGIVQLPPGKIEINGTISSNSACTIQGVGSGNATYGNYPIDFGATMIHQNNLTADTFLFTTLNGVHLRNFTIVVGDRTNGSGAAIHIRPAAQTSAEPNRGSKISNVGTAGGGFGIWCENCAFFNFTGNQIQNFTLSGIYISHPLEDIDQGDGLISGNQICACIVGQGEAAIKFDTAGAVHITGNKLLYGKYGMLLNVSGGPTGTLVISGNSIEEQSVSNITIRQTVPGAKYANVMISDNEFNNGETNAKHWQSGIAIQPGNTTYLENVTIHDNTINSGGSAYQLPIGIYVGDGNHVQVHHNIIRLYATLGSVGIYTGTNAKNVLVDNNKMNSVLKSYQFDVPTTVVDHAGTSFANLPQQNVADGSQFYVQDGRSGSWPCTGTSSGAMAMRQGGSWKCF